MPVRPIHRVLVRGPILRSRFHTAHALLAARKVLHTFKLADIGEGITECEVIKWSVKEQTPIRSFDALCEVQSDKASVEITSPFDGVVKQLLVQEGEIAKVGSGLCLIEAEEEDDHASPSPPDTQSSTSSPLPPAAEQSQPSQTQKQAPAEFVDAAGTREVGRDEVRVPTRKHPLDPTNSTSTSFASSQSDNSLATPSVRHFARQHGVDLSVIAPGSGRDGRVERKDVETFIARGRVSITQEAIDSTPKAEDKDAIVELGRTRYGMWKAMTQSLEIPRFGYSTSLDLTRFHGLLPLLNANIPAHYLPEPSRSRNSQMVNPSALYPAPTPPCVPESGKFTKLTYLPFLVKTLANAMMEWPLFRASITPSPSSSPPSPGSTTTKPTLTIRPTADLSLALSTPTGLYTPTLVSAQTHSIHALASQIAHLAYLGRQVPCALTPREMPKRGGTVSVSNVGAIGKGEGASPVLVPGGGVAIVAIGRAMWVWDVSEAVWRDGGGADDGEDGDLDVHALLGGRGRGRGRGRGQRRLKVDVSWSADHRVVEGAELAAFVETWRGWVENPERLIAEGV